MLRARGVLCASPLNPGQLPKPLLESRVISGVTGGLWLWNCGEQSSVKNVLTAPRKTDTDHWPLRLCFLCDFSFPLSDKRRPHQTDNGTALPHVQNSCVSKNGDVCSDTNSLTDLSVELQCSLDIFRRVPPLWHFLRCLYEFQKTLSGIHSFWLCEHGLRFSLI